MLGRIFIVGDSIDTDQLAPGQYMKGGIGELAAHCLEMVRPDFAATVGKGDILVAGRNFGLGSSREQAAEALKYLGVQAVVAQSFGGIFYRNAINLGLPVLVADDIQMINEGDKATLDIENATLTLIPECESDESSVVLLQPVPANIQQLLRDGGLVAHLKNRFAKAGTLP